MALLAPASPAPADRLRFDLVGAVFVVCAWATYCLVLRYLRGERYRQQMLEEAARIEGATLATRTLRHHLGNKLNVAAGYSEILADDPRLAPELGEHAHKILASALAAVAAMDALEQPLLRIQLDASVAGPALLDVPVSRAGASEHLHGSACG